MKLLSIDAVEQLNALLMTLSDLPRDGTRFHARLDVFSCKMVTQDKKLLKQFRERYGDTAPLLTSPVMTGSVEPVMKEEAFSLDGDEQYSHSRGVTDSEQISIPAPSRRQRRRHSISVMTETPLEKKKEKEISIPLNDHHDWTVFGPWHNKSAKKTLLSLIGVLNSLYPDYDFLHITPDQFMRHTESLPVLLHGLAARLNTTAGMPSLTLLVNRLITVIPMALSDSNGVFDIYEYKPRDTDDDPRRDAGSLWSFLIFFYARAQKRVAVLEWTLMACWQENESDASSSGEMELADEKKLAAWLRREKRPRWSRTETPVEDV